MAATFDDIRCSTINVPETGISPQTRATVLALETLKRFPVPLTSLRVWDAAQTNLPGTAATDDLALIAGTWGSAPLLIQAGDLKSAGATTRRAIFELVVPECYVAGNPFNLVFSAGMKTTIAGTSCTIDAEVYKRDKISGIGSDLVSTAATSINSLTFADKSFTITPTSLSPGDILECRVSIACNDGAGITAVTPTIASIDIACDIRG